MGGGHMLTRSVLGLLRTAVVSLALVLALTVFSAGAFAVDSGWVEGRVLDNHTSLPIANATVTWGHHAGGGGYDVSGNLTTDADGHYEAYLPTGDYMIYAYGPADRYQALYYPNTPNSQRLEHITIDTETTTTLSAMRLRPYGALAGRAIEKKTGDPVAGSTVRAFATPNFTTPVEEVGTDAKGDYVFTHLLEGTYKLQFLGPNRNGEHGYADAAYPGIYDYYVDPSRGDTVTVASDGETSTVPLDMPLVHCGTITAHAVDWLTGAPISNPWFPFNAGPNGDFRYGAGAWAYQFSDTRCDLVYPGYWGVGFYEVVNPYYLYYREGQATQYYQNSTLLYVADGEDYEVTARIFPNTTVSGHVTQAIGLAAVPGCTVEPYVKIGGVWTLAKIGITTETDGSWTFTDIAPDVYRFKITPPEGSKLVPAWFTGGSTVASDVALVPYADPLTNIDVALLSDTTGPNSHTESSPESASGHWLSVAKVSVSIWASDGTNGIGVKDIYYKFGLDGAAQTYSGTIEISAEGTTDIYYQALDKFDNVGPGRVFHVMIDRTKPLLTHSVTPAPASSIVSLSATDTFSGVSAIKYRLDGAAETTYTAPLTLAVGTHQIVAYARDVAGNTSESETFTAVASLTPTTLGTPVVSPSKPKHKKNAAFTVTISSADAAKSAQTKLSLWRWEIKKVKGKKVGYWRLRKTIVMKAVGSKLTASYKLPYAGKWRAQASFVGNTAWGASLSKVKAFTAK
jgi:hypothetical protein